MGIGQLRDALGALRARAGRARREAADYARRGELAGAIEDQETVRIAEEFTAKARERVDLLERKVIVQRDELAMAEREYEVTKQRFQAASRGLPLDGASAADSSAGGRGALVDRIRPMMDQRAKEAAVEAQLAHLKKKLGERK